MKRPRFSIPVRLSVAAVALPAAALLSMQPALADNADRGYAQHNLVSDIPGLAPITDPHLVNPWGMSAGPSSPLWISDNGTGLTTLYDGSGHPFPSGPNGPLVVTIATPPSAGSGAVSAPTGQVFNTFDNTTSDFVITKNGKSGPAFFRFATEDGTISGWNPNVDPTHSVIAVDRSNAVDTTGDLGAVYKSLTLVTTPAGKFLYASNFRFGTIEVFDTHFNLVDVLRDPRVSAGFAPFGVNNVAGTLFVTFAQQNAAKHDDVAGDGNGFVDTFGPGTNVLHRFATRGKRATRAVKIAFVDERLRLLRYCREAPRPLLKRIDFGAELDEFVGFLVETFGNVLVLDTGFAELDEGHLLLGHDDAGRMRPRV